MPLIGEIASSVPAPHLRVVAPAGDALGLMYQTPLAGRHTAASAFPSPS